MQCRVGSNDQRPRNVLTNEKVPKDEVGDVEDTKNGCNLISRMDGLLDARTHKHSNNKLERLGLMALDTEGVSAKVASEPSIFSEDHLKTSLGRSETSESDHGRSKPSSSLNTMPTLHASVLIRFVLR